MMKVLFFVLLALTPIVMADDIDLTEADFQSTLDDNEFVLVMFYAPWCGHCKSLKPHFTEAATEVKGKYVLAKVDCTDDEAKPLCESFSVKGYPTVKFFKNGTPMDYTGPRTAEGIVAWLDKKSGPAFVTLEADGVDAFTSEGGVVFTGDIESDAGQAFVKLCDSALLDAVKFAAVAGSENTVSFYRPGRDTVTFDVNDDTEKAILGASFPLVDEISGENYSKYASLGQPLYLIFANKADTETLIPTIEAVAATTSDQKFGWIDAEKFASQMQPFGCSGDVVPCVTRIGSFGGSSMKPIVFEEELTEESLTEFVAGVASGKYVYTPKSEAVPEDNSGPVFTVVGSTFQDTITAADKNVFVEFYAPWCGHCKKLIPVWEELGESFADRADIVIAKMDATANDFEADGVDVKGFPTLYFFPAGSDAKAILYQGGRDVESLSTFVNENAVEVEEGKTEL